MYATFVCSMLLMYETFSSSLNKQSCKETTVSVHDIKPAESKRIKYRVFLE